MNFRNINAEEFAQLKEIENHVVLDVRSPQELIDGEVPGYLMINFFDASFKEEIAKLDQDKTYLVYCRSGNRSGQACALMSQMGFQNLCNLVGGIGAWNQMVAV